MKKLAILITFLGFITQSSANPPMYHEMQHGFVLSDDDKFASHLVATGHHSRQAEIISRLIIEDSDDKEIYMNRRILNTSGGSYFLFQAQNLNLPALKEGQILNGHIVESKSGEYEPKNIIVKKATLVVERVLLNIENPFFKD
ncbi:MAG: hypothetical protein K2Q18_15475 [Bdellovibrionales bacterium]|nr:hypothetical protein [Bdellovibrionales bacterium]